MNERGSIDWWLATLPLDGRIARARIRYSHHVLARVTVDGVCGFGAAALYARAPHQVRALRPHLAALARDLPYQDAAEAREVAAGRLAGVSDLLSALDGALWELEAIRRGCRVAEVLGASRPLPAVSITEQLFLDAAERPERAVESALARGTKTLKIKLHGHPDRDLRLLRRLREAAGPALHLRVDANRGYSPQDALAVAGPARELGIVDWEEPLDSSFAELARWREATGARVILDESVRDLAQLEEALAWGCFDVLNLKLSRLGGITGAAEYRRRCLEEGRDVLIGCNEDLGPGMAALLHTSAAWQPFETEGLGHERLGVDFGRPSPHIAGGMCALPAGPGWGLSVDPERVLHPPGHRPTRLVHVTSWSLPFAVVSMARRHRQRAENVRVRAGRRVRASLVSHRPPATHSRSARPR